jgi:hypothetical protein
VALRGALLAVPEGKEKLAPDAAPEAKDKVELEDIKTTRVGAD